MVALGLAWRGMAPASPVPAHYVDEATCGSCHASEAAAWSGSHHAFAMQVATPAAVQGDFAGVAFAGSSGLAAFFSQDAEGHEVRASGADGGQGRYRVGYTIGVDPLQQYLLELPRGRLQAFSVAWDTRQRRWYELDPEGPSAPGEALHWSSAAYTWNYMCAGCHVTGLEKNYDVATDSYQTRFVQPNVGCQACHGPASRHLDNAAAGGRVDAARDFAAVGGEAELAVCAGCHARHVPVGPQHRAGAPLLDAVVPVLLQDPLYYADGQIRGEVFEYGSFLQSRMHARGVRCSDCHQPHALALRAPGNAVCTGCHTAGAAAVRAGIDAAGLARREYDSPAHHFHEPGGPGSRCVDCHMPTRTYMQVDARHDHSIRIPRPDLAQALGTPDACSNCHGDRGAGWAATVLAGRRGAAATQPGHYGEALHAGRTGRPGAAALLAGLVADHDRPAIVRATALDLLRGLAMPTPATLGLFASALSDPEPLLRLQAVRGFALAGIERRGAVLVPLLADPVRAVRIEAARLLAGTALDRGDGADAARLHAVIDEYITVQRGNADRPEAHVNLGNLHAARGDAGAARRAFDAALRLDAGFTAAVVNLAELEAGLGRLADAERILRDALAAHGDAADLHHALGLVLVRRQRSGEALDALRRATELAPQEPHYLYVQGVAVHDLVDAGAGLALLQEGLQRFPDDRELLQAMAGYSRAAGDEATAQRHLDRLRRIIDPQAVPPAE